MFVYCIHDMLLIVYVLDSLFFATPKSKRVLMHVWRHMLLTLWFVDSLYFATPKSRRVCFVLGCAQLSLAPRARTLLGVLGQATLRRSLAR